MLNPGKSWRDKECSEGLGRDEPHGAADGVILPARGSTENVVDEVLERRRTRGDIATNRREFPAVCTAVEKPHAEGRLKPIQPTTNGRVVDPEEGRRGDESARAGDREKHPEVVCADLVRIGGGHGITLCRGSHPGSVRGHCDTVPMDPIVALLIGLAVGVVLGALIGALVMRSRSGGTDAVVLEARHAAVVAEVRAQEAAARAEVEVQLAAAQASLTTLHDQLAGAQEQYRVLVERQRSDAQAQAEREQRESKVLQALAPVQESLRTVQNKVTELESQRANQHGEITQQLRAALESDERLRATTESLASALRSNSTRGVWGETQLRNVVQAAGLLERVDFDVQSTISSDAGAGRPDMVIHLPGGKNIAVDAKVPFAAYLEAAQIPATAAGDEAARRESLLKQHVKAMRAHVDALASKAYWAGLEASPELVIAFIPSESLVSSALEADPGIMDYAFGKRVALASPVTLWSVLKTVAFSWQQDVLTDQAKVLFDLGKELYARLATLSEHADRLRKSIDATVSSYNQFANSLESRVLVTARKLNALDESKVIGEATTIEHSPKQLTAVELELATLEELEGVGRPELELPDLPEAPAASKSA